MKKYVLYINYNDQLLERILPGTDNRQGSLDFSRETGIRGFRIAYEVWDGVWHLLTNAQVRLSKDHVVQEDVVLREGEVLHGKILNKEIRFSLMVDVLDGRSAYYEKYDIRSREQIRIGRNNGCDIVLNDMFVGGTHAAMFRRDNGWYIQDSSTNGTYVNGKRLTAVQRLHVFDSVYILGFKFIYLGNMLAANRTDKQFVRLPKAEEDNLADRQMHEDISAFSRTPRQIEPLDEEVIEIEAPPALAKMRKTPLLFILGPSLTMPIPILSMVLFNVIVNSGSGVRPLSYAGMAISVMMFALVGIFWTIMRNRYDKKAAIENEAHRQSSYQEYLRQNERLLAEKQVKNKNILENMYRQTELLATELLNNRFALWNRNVNHADFLHIRIGEGCMESPNPIQVPKSRFSMEADALATLPQQLHEKYRYLAPVVKTLDVRKNKLIGMVGDKRQMNEAANSMVVQLAALHSYTDVKIAFLMTREDGLNLQWAKWLPHTFSDDKKIRFMADEEHSRQNVLYTLSGILRARKEEREQSQADARYARHYVVFTTDKAIYERETIYKYMVDNLDYGFTFIMLHGKMDALPNECKCILDLSGYFQGMYMLDESRTFANQVKFDKLNLYQAERFARGISGVYIHELAEGAIPESIDYLEMLGIGRIEQWDLLKHYKENRSFEGIKALIGVASNDKPLILDIHEKKYGPHGLIAGTTGSGKSETIQTFILSLALNYHPDEVAFILIDYKGGGMANAFRGLPHLAGTITNLGDDGTESESVGVNQTRRALISIRSEIKRRQAIFNRYRVNHIDLYMRLYREGKTKEPMPHLVIISDEFAELKKEQPEFIRELVSTARVGRSLGIHLILATQKPAGVVDEEIWSNARFKICLRVQDKQDSVGMLKRPEAAMLTLTGRAYLQIGNDELFELFQSGYSGAAYEPRQEARKASDEEAAMIGLDGTESVLRPKHSYAEAHPQTQLEICIKYIIDRAKEYAIGPTMPLWLPKLSGRITLQGLEEKYDIDYGKEIMAVIGEVDDPEQQKQYPLKIELNQMPNLIIAGSAGSGKTTLLKTMIVSLAGHYGPEEVWIYCMDFSSRTFRVFEQLPHCGGVVFSEEEEKVERLFRLMGKYMDERKKILEESGVGSYGEYRKTGQRLPAILLIVDNYFEFSQRFAALEDTFLNLTRDCVRYGIFTIVTVNRPGDMRYKVRQNFNRILPLHLADRGEYLEIFGHTPEILAENVPGRGLVLRESILEYQAALPAPGGNETDRTAYIRKWIAKALTGGKGMEAPGIPVLPVEEAFPAFFVKYKQLMEKEDLLPLGYDKKSLNAIGMLLKKDYCFCISANKKKSLDNVFKNIAYAVKTAGYQMDIVDEGAGEEEGYHGYDKIRELLIALKKEFKERKIQGQDYKDKRFVLIRNMKAFMERIYDKQNPEAMYPLVEVFFKEGSGRGIYFIGGFLPEAQNSYLYLQACRYFTGYKKIWHLGGMLGQQKLAEFRLPLALQTKALPFNEGHGLEEETVYELFIPDNGEDERAWTS